jgi:predicted enzyme related to lactoylglutathione lyase
MAHALNWFEIPATDIQRAVRFYSTILGIKLETGPASPGYQMAVIPHADGVGGALIQGEGFVPSTNGAVIYLACDPDLRPALGRVEAAGGKILAPRTDIGENGFFAFILDTEGNKVGLHSMS